MKNRYESFFYLTEKIPRFFISGVSLFLFLLQAPTTIQAQNKTDPATEKQLKKDAVNDFDNDDFINAYTLYSQLLSLYPRDPNYNYHFGACILFTTSDKKKAIKYIQYGAKQPTVDNLAFYYLGRAQHLNYEFTEAQSSYEKYEQAATPGELKKHPVTHLIEMCKNGKDLIATSQELDVLRKTQLNLSNFFRAYNMHGNRGSLISEPDEFKSKLDKEKKVTNLMYVTPDRSKAFFSSYGMNEDNGKDIYVINKQTDGSWGVPQNLGTVINTAFDEDYPVYDAPRHTLYFSSKGHNSMGGYDIFASVYSDSSQTWSEPYNLDFPINTPDDDILLVPDTGGQTAFFASARLSPAGKIDVYKIALHLHPPESIVIAGTVYKAGGKTIITVRDSATANVIAVDTVSSQDGNYSFNLRKGGKYNFTVEDSAHKGQSQSVILAMEEANIGIKQNIQFDASGALQIKNFPAETSKDSTSRLALQYIQNEAQMNVNVDTNNIQSLLAQNISANSNKLATSSNSTTTNIQTGQTGLTSVSLTDTTHINSNANSSNVVKNNTPNIETMHTDSVKTMQLEHEQQQLNGKTAKAIDYASDKMEQAQQLQEQINDIANNPNGNNNSAANSDSVAKWSAESKIAAKKGMDAYRLAAEYKNEVAAKQLEINKIANTNSSSNPGINTQLNNQNQGTDPPAVSTASVNPGDLIRQQAEQVKKDSSELAQSNFETTQEISGLQQKSDEFAAQAAQTGDPQQKAALSQQANDLLKSKEQKQDEIKDNAIQLGQLHDEYTWLTNKARKADSTSFAAANTANNINPISQTALQQEIDAYAVSNGADSSSEGTDVNSNQIAGNNENQNTSTKNGTTHNARHSKYFYHKNSIGQSQSGNIAANNQQTGNLSTTNSGNQNTQTPNNNQSTSTVNGNNSSTNNSQSTNVSGTQNTQTANNNQNTSTVTGNNSSANNSQSTNNTSGNQNTQTANNNLNTSTVTGNNSSTNNSQSTNNLTGNQNTQVTSNNNTTTTSANNHPDSSIYYYRAPNTVLLDSLANTSSKSNSVSPNYFNNQGTASVSSVQYTDTVLVALEQKSQHYFEAANLLADTAQKIRNEARDEKDKSRLAVLYNKMDSINGLIFQLNLKGDEIISEANTRQYTVNSNQITGIAKPSSNSRSAKITKAKNILKDADYSYRKSLSERDSANSTSLLSNKLTYMESSKKDLATAILKQQSAVYLYFQADSTQTVRIAGTSNSDNTPHFNYSDFLKTQGKKKVNTSTASNSNSSNSSSNTNNSLVTNSNTAIIDSSKNTSATSSQNTGTIDNNASSSNISAVTVFTETDKSAYSVSKPIPVDPAIPKGLVFGVQIGAFRNSIPPNLFKGFKPIIGLKAPEGYVRYIAGLYTSIDPAKDAAGKIRNLGYTGAFVVAFYDGQRITLKEALAKLGISTSSVAAVENSQTNNTRETGTTTTSSNNTNTSEGNQATVLAENTIVPSMETLIETKRKSIRAIKDTVPPAANSINNVKGLLYTVQVGSFSTHKGFTRLRKIKQLYSWTDPNGTIKYNSGTYKSVADARAAKDIIVANTSVKDAFVTAYYNGKRITIAEARNLSGNLAAPTNASTTYTIPRANNLAPVSTVYKEVDSSSFALASQTKVIYTVRIASFTGSLPVDTVNKLLSYASEGIEPYKEQEGVTAYYAGKFPDYAEATVLQQKFFKGGFHQADIMAYYQGKKISMKEALSITNK